MGGLNWPEFSQKKEMQSHEEPKPEFKPIQPEFVEVYSWDMMPTGPYLVVTIKTPEGFDATKVKAELNEDNTAISVRYPDQPPILEGLLFEKVKSMEMKINSEEKNITVTVAINSEKAPELLVTDIHPQTHRMDPLSAFITFNMRSHSEDMSQQKGCFRYLEFGLEANFVPAMLAAASIFQRIPQLADQSFHLVRLAADIYNSPPALLQMGLFLINSPQKELALEYMEKAAAHKGFPFAKALLGTMLSPIADMECPKKDAKRAAELFEEVLKEDENPMALHELAMLLYNGIGVEKNVERAKELNERCKKLERNQTPELEERDESYVPKPPVCHCGCECEHDHCGCECEHDHCGCESGHGHCDGHGGCGCGGHCECEGHGHCDGHGGCGCHGH